MSNDEFARVFTKPVAACILRSKSRGNRKRPSFFPRLGDEFMNFLPNNSLLRERGVAAEGQAHRLEGILSFSFLAARPRCGRPSSRWKSQLSVRTTEKRRRRQILETIAYVRSLINLSTLPKSAQRDERWESALESRSREARSVSFLVGALSILRSKGIAVRPITFVVPRLAFDDIYKYIYISLPNSIQLIVARYAGMPHC